MKHLIVDNRILCTEPNDENSQNYFRAAECFEQNRRFILVEGKEKNDVVWMMRILPYIAKYFNVDRKMLLKNWIEDYGLKVCFGLSNKGAK